MLIWWVLMRWHKCQIWIQSFWRKNQTSKKFHNFCLEKTCQFVIVFRCITYRPIRMQDSPDMTTSDWLLKQDFQNKFFVALRKISWKGKTAKSMKSREEIRFLALLNKSQEKAASLKNKESDKISAIIEDEWRVPKVIIFPHFSSNCS